MSDFAVMFHTLDGSPSHCLIQNADSAESAIARARRANCNPTYGVRGMDTTREVKAVEIFGHLTAKDGKMGEVAYDHAFVARLRQAADGANTHTVNKAAHYYDLAHREKRWVMMALISNAARLAFVTGDWKPLHGLMAGWF